MTSHPEPPHTGPPLPTPRDRLSQRAASLSGWDVVLSSVALFVLAISLPLLDLLGRNAEFFLAQASSRSDIVLLGVLLALVIPVSVGLIAFGLFKLNRTAGVVLLGVLIATMAGIFVLRIIGLTPATALPAWVEIGLAATLGTLLAVAFVRFVPVRSFVKFMAIAPVIALGMFLFTSSTSQLIFASNDVTKPSGVTVDNPAPIVVVVYDEFPVASIMDADGSIEEEVYPGFARLAQDATWYRNAITVQQQTERALPVIVSGNDAHQNKLPTAGDYPFTLFTLLAEAYDLHVYETVSDLCPEYACANSTRPVRPFSERWEALIDDLRIVSGHLFLPDDLADDLPPIDSTWSNFSAGGDNTKNIIARFQELTYEADRRDPIQEVVSLVGTASDEPRFVFLHALVPHVPWEYLPSGQQYAAPGSAPGTKSPGWGEDDWLVSQAYQMHLAQVGYADTTLADLITSMESAGTYDETLLVVLADHGVRVQPNTKHRRVANDETVGDIAAIPLFIKLPGQTTGVIDDYRAETIDILPTIADVVDARLPWSVEGTSLIADDRPTRSQSQIAGSDGVIEFGVDGSEAAAAAARKIAQFGDNGPFGLAPPGYASLLGRPITDFSIETGTGATGNIRNKPAYASIDLDGPVIPSWVSGRVSGIGTTPGIIAIIVNDQIAAITRTTTNEDGAEEYGAIVPPTAFIEGKNSVELAVVRPDGSGWLLETISS